MNVEFAQELCELNNRFYRTWASSFSDTRHNVWPGWKRCLEEAGPSTGWEAPHTRQSVDHKSAAQTCGADSAAESSDTGEPVSYSVHRSSMRDEAKNSTPLHMLDVACGNLRFEDFLARALPHRSINTYALDACDELATEGVGLPGNAKVEFRHCDVMEELQAGTLSNTLQGKKPAELTVSFGFMHHIPLPEWRETLLKSLLQATKPGGYVCVSLWRFLNDGGLAAKAEATTAQGIKELGYSAQAFDEGDRLLGWKNEPGAFRYCHSFSDSEIDELIESVSEISVLKARWQSDGRTGNLNEYLVLQRK